MRRNVYLKNWDYEDRLWYVIIIDVYNVWLMNHFECDLVYYLVYYLVYFYVLFNIFY